MRLKGLDSGSRTFSFEIFQAEQNSSWNLEARGEVEAKGSDSGSRTLSIQATLTCVKPSNRTP